MKLNTIEEALADFKAGKFVIVVDDEDRENEGDLICAAEKITPRRAVRPSHHQPRQGTGPAPPGTGQHIAAGDTVHCDGRQDRRLLDGGVSPRPRRYHTGTGRSHIDLEDLRTPGTYQSAIRSGQWCAAPLRSHRGCHRPV